MKTLTSTLALISFAFFSFNAIACSPCGNLSNVTQTLTGNSLELNFTSHAGWDCCYTVEIEIICDGGTFTGIPNYFSSEICLNGGGGFSSTNTLVTPYPPTIIDISGFCPGTYSWRAAETSCYIYTPVQTFTVVGTPSPIILTASVADDTLCITESTQFTASATNGCANGPYSYSWSPSLGLSNANIPNPIATPLSTTTYTLTVTETGTCIAPQTASFTITVNPVPLAYMTGTISLCQTPGTVPITFTGANGTAPYTISYNLNGVPQTPLLTTGTSATIQVPSSTPGTTTYTLTGVTESSSVQCSQTISQFAVVTVYPLPVVDAGTDQVLCTPNGNSPSDVTLNGSGADTYTWDNGVTNGVTFTPPSGTTLYTVTGTDINGCTDTDVMSITALTQPIANGSANDLFGNAPLTVDFTNLSQFASSYVWDFGNGNVQAVGSASTISNTFLTAGTYTVVLTASNGICFDTWTTEIEVIPPMIVTPPNVFSPNGDNTNDDYFVDVQWGAVFEALIVNRWGNEVTTLTHLNQGWDGTSNGKDLEEGVYFIEYKATDYNGGIIEGHTPIQLIR